MGFFIALAWQVLAVSTGASVILIKRDTTVSTTSLFLVPPVTAQSSPFSPFNELLTPVNISGFLMASAGVYLVTRHSRAL